MKTTDDYKEFGKILVDKLRDENFQTYLEYKEYTSTMTIDEYQESFKNPEYDPELQKLKDERFTFFKSLNDEQKEQLDKLVLSVIDATAFNFLREIEEKMSGENGLRLNFGSNGIDQIYSEFLSGTFFGEYFLWIEKFSKYGKYQY